MPHRTETRHCSYSVCAQSLLFMSVALQIKLPVRIYSFSPLNVPLSQFCLSLLKLMPTNGTNHDYAYWAKEVTTKKTKKTMYLYILLSINLKGQADITSVENSKIWKS